MKPKSKKCRKPTKAEDALVKINKLIFAKGAPLGSDTYFAIRGICCDTLREAGLIETLTKR